MWVHFGLRTFNCNPVCTWSPTTSNDSRQLGVTPGCDPWSECLGGDVVNLNRHSLRLPAQLSRLSETWPLAPASRQNNNTMSRRLIEVVDDSLFTWTTEPTFSALLSACSSGSFFALKPFPTFPFPLHPWTSDFFVYLPCSPPRSTPSLPLLTPPPLSVLPAWIYCLFGWGAHLDLILPVEPSCLSPLCAGRY